MTSCSIIIPTYNRPNYLRRILDYYNLYGKDFRIIVADSSSDENKELNRNIILLVSNLDIQYFDNYSTEINPHHKMADAVNYARTKYCVFCADDDFVVPNGIRQSVDFLERNLDFAVAHGRYIGFYLDDNERGKQQFCWKPADSRESITFADPKTRLNHHLSNYSQSTVYGVHRTDFLEMVYKEVLKSRVNPLFFGELLPSMLTLIYGQMKCLDVLYAARAEDSIRLGYWPTLGDAIKTGIYDEEYAKFRDCLSTHLSKQSQLDIKESRMVVDKAMSAYMQKYFYPSKSKLGMGYFSTKMGYFLDYLNLPAWLDRGIRRSYTKLTRSGRAKKNSIDMPPPSKYADDFNKIRLHVLSYSKINAK